MLRLALIFALLASVAVLALSLFVAKPKVTELADTLTSTKSSLAQSETARSKAEADAKTSKLLAEKAAKDLSETKQDLEAARTEEANQHGRADRLDKELTKVKIERKEAQDELSQWELTGIKPQQVAVMRAEIKKATEKIEVVESEKKVLSHKVDSLEARLHRYEADVEPPVEMPDLRSRNAKVTGVDSKWNFIVIDAGSDRAKENGIVLIRRNDKLVGKARIVRVEADRSFANLLPEWQQANSSVAEGDIVLY